MSSSSITAVPGTATAELQHRMTNPPSNNTHFPTASNPHAAAHAVLEELRESGDPQWLFLRTVLEQTQLEQQQVSEELLFHCISGARHVLLTQWMNYSPSFVSAVRDLFMHLGFNNFHQNSGGAKFVSKTVRIAYFTSSVAIWKRQWADLLVQPEHSPQSPSTPKRQQAIHPEQEHHILQQIGQIGMEYGMTAPLSSPADLFQFLTEQMTKNCHDRANLQVTCQFLSAMVGEFSGKSAVVPYSLPLEFHKEAYRHFEKAATGATTAPLEECLRLAMTALSSIVNQMPEGDDGIGISQSVVQVTIDVIGWEFGGAEWMHLPSSRTLIRPPGHWREYLMRPDFIGAVFGIHEQIVRRRISNNGNRQDSLAHDIRQLLLSLCSLTGPMFKDKQERELFAHYLCEGTQQLLTLCAEFLNRQQQNGDDDAEDQSSLLFDTYSLLARMISNFRLAILSNQPTLIPLLDQLRATATMLLRANVSDCESVGGEIEMMENIEWRNEALSLVLEVVLLLCQDPWLKDTRTDETSRRTTQAKLTQTLGPLYGEFVSCKGRIAYLETGYLAKEEAIDNGNIKDPNTAANSLSTKEDNQEIDDIALEEEMAAIACLGRLHLPSALSCMSSLFQGILPKLQEAWKAPGPVTPDIAALLEETRLMVLHMGYLLTDGGESKNKQQSKVPLAIDWFCSIEPSLVEDIASLMQAILGLMEAQVASISQCPSNPRPGATLGNTFLWFLTRWAPAFLCQIADDNTTNNSKLLGFWSGHSDSTKRVVAFSIWLCSQYQAYWPENGPIQSSAASLLNAMAQQSGQMRAIMIQQPALQQMVLYLCVTIGIPSCLSNEDQFDTAVRSQMSKFPNASSISDTTAIRGLHKLSYDDKSSLLTALLVTCGDESDNTATAMFTELLKSLESTFLSLMQALSAGQASKDDAQTMAIVGLCVELFRGVVRTNTSLSSHRIPKFVTPCLPQLAGLMEYYADNIVICERLLNLFCDYPMCCGECLDQEQIKVLFQTAAILLKSYSSHHCTARLIRPKESNGKDGETEEEKAYNDILCAIRMLTNLMRVDISLSSGGSSGVDSSEVLFFGLQQIIPLMTQGLIQYPTCCREYFSLVGSAMKTHSRKVSMLPYELLDALFESLLFGISHHERAVAEICLEGIEDLFTEHLKSGVLRSHLVQGQQNGKEVLEHCTQRILKDVVYQQLVMDRLEATSNAILPLAAIDVSRFVAAANRVTQSGVNPEQLHRLHAAYQKLLQHDVISQAIAEGYEGRYNQKRFKEDFEEFVNDVHSFLMFR